MALELFGEDFKNELLEELVQLNVKWECQEARTGLRLKMFRKRQAGVVRKLKISETQGNSATSKTPKAVNIYMT